MFNKRDIDLSSDLKNILLDKLSGCKFFFDIDIDFKGILKILKILE